MSVYYGENPEYLKASMESIFAQTVPTNDFVLMCDGPLTEALDQVIQEMAELHGDVLRVVRLEENRGLGDALNYGLVECRNELIARMDSDDIALPTRCQLQLEKFAQDPELVIVGGAIDEFEGSPENVVSHKQMPETYEEVLKYARTRNPFNHPTVMYRRSTVLALGSYPHNILHEDYALWANILMAGYKGCNLPQTLCRMRVDSGLYDRRGGLAYLKLAIRLRWGFYKQGLCSIWSFLYTTASLTVVCLLPSWVRRLIYRCLLR